MIIKALTVFVAIFVLDFFWAKYTACMTRKLAHKASLYSSLIILANGVAVVIYAGEPLMVLPAALGAYAGTFVAVKLDAST